MPNDDVCNPRQSSALGATQISANRSKAEQDRLDAVHEGFVMIAGDKLCQAPVIKNPEVQRVLDLGTGTGIWAIDFACQNPHAEVIGMDLRSV